MIIDKIYSDRFRNDGKAVIPLNGIQLQEIEKYKAKLKSGYYREESVETCPLCRDNTSYLIAEKDRYGLPLKTVVCQRCGLVRTVNRLDEVSARRFYGEQYRTMYMGVASYDQKLSDMFALSSSSSTTKGAARIVKLLGLDPETSIVAEVGAGGGWNLLPFKKLGFHCAGCDFDEAYLELGREFGIEMVHGSIEQLISSFGKKKADLVMINHVFEHVVDPMEFLSQLGQLIVNDGFLRIAQPGLLAIRWGYAKGDLLGTLQNAHNYLFDLFTLKWAAGCHGFKLLWGDEMLSGVFQKYDHSAPLPLPDARGDNILRYLRSLERTRKYWILWDKVCEFTRDPYNTHVQIRRLHYCLGFPRQYFFRKLLEVARTWIE